MNDDNYKWMCVWIVFYVLNGGDVLNATVPANKALCNVNHRTRVMVETVEATRRASHALTKIPKPLDQIGPRPLINKESS